MSPHLIQTGLTLHDSVLGDVLGAAKKSSSSATFLIFIGIIIVLYLVVLRPQSQKRKRAVQQGQTVDVGDEVMLSSGIIGRVTELEGDRASIEIAPDIEIEVVRRAIAQRLTQAEPTETSTIVPPDPGLEGEDDYAHASDDSDEEHTDAPGDTQAHHDGSEDEPAESGDDENTDPTAVATDSKDTDGWAGGRLP